MVRIGFLAFMGLSFLRGISRDNRIVSGADNGRTYVWIKKM